MAEGIPAYHYRITVHDGSLLNVLVSEDLGAIVAETRSKASSSRETGKKLTHIRRGEPSPALFEIPEGIKVQYEHPQRTAIAH
jgi:hypothetical protein